jgi:hypothetical protein
MNLFDIAMFTIIIGIALQCDRELMGHSKVFLKCPLPASSMILEKSMRFDDPR